MKNWMIASCHKAKFEVASIGNQGVGWTTFVQRVNGTKKWHVSDEAHGISRVGATCVAKKSAKKCDCDGAIFKSSSQNSEKGGILLNSLSAGPMSGLFPSISDKLAKNKTELGVFFLRSVFFSIRNFTDFRKFSTAKVMF